MKYIAALVLLVSLGIASAQIQKGQLENIDVDSLLKNERYVRTQVNCVLEKGKCDKTGRDLKGLLPEVLKRNCASCSAEQKTNADKIVNFMKTNHAQDWVSIEAKYSA